MDMDVLISTTDGPVDMKNGLDTMQGVSNAVRTIVDASLSDNVQKKKTSKDKVRTNLKKSFTGSYGHIFSIDVYDEKLKEKFDSLGENVWTEIIAYFLNESVYLDGGKLSTKADEFISNIGDRVEEITNQIRYSCLKDVHQVPIGFGETVTIRSRLKVGQQIPLISFDKETAKVLKPIRSKETIKISAIITRLNIHTGNGRLQLDGASETVAFGFGVKYKEVQSSWKKKFSKNLDINNGRSEDKWEFLDLVVEPVKLKNGRIIKYIIKSNEK